MGFFDFLKKSGMVHTGGTSYTVKGGKNGPEYKNREGKNVTDQVINQDLRNVQNQTEDATMDTDSGFSGSDDN
ncbi:MAG: hypothetical protein WC437_03835 [Patescibacteria group bacterium]|jgi:hypothetical protein